MTYSCTDFTDSILDALGIVVPEDDYDNPSAQADLALAAIAKLQGNETRLKAVPNDGVNIWNRRRRIAELAAHARSYALHGTAWALDVEHALREALQIIETLKTEGE